MGLGPDEYDSAAAAGGLGYDPAAAVGSLFQKYYRTVYGYCVGRLFVRDLAEDAASAAFLRLVEEYDRFKGKGDKEICAWLYMTAGNIATNYIRTHNRRQEILMEVARLKRDPAAQRPAAFDQLDWPAVYGAMLKLDEREQEAITLRYIEEMALPEIARVLGLSPGATRTLLSRAVTRLRQELEKTLG